MSDSWPSSVADEPSDSISARAVEVERALRTLEAVEAFRAEAAALRAELQAARAAAARRPTRRRTPTPDLPEATWRLIAEAALIVGVAVVVWAAHLQRRDIVLTLAGAWVVVAVVEAIASRRSDLRWSPPPPPVVGAVAPVAEPAPPPPAAPPEVVSERAWPARPEIAVAYAQPEPEPALEPEPVTLVQPPAVAEPAPASEVELEPRPEPEREPEEEAAVPDQPVVVEEEAALEAPKRRGFRWRRVRSPAVEPEPESEEEAEPETQREPEPEPAAAADASERVGGPAEALDDWPDDLHDGHLVGAVAALEEAAARLEEAMMATPGVSRRWRLRGRRMHRERE